MSVGIAPNSERTFELCVVVDHASGRSGMSRRSCTSAAIEANLWKEESFPHPPSTGAWHCGAVRAPRMGPVARLGARQGSV